MKINEFVVKVANPFIYVNDIVEPPLDYLRRAMSFAVKNKVFPLFYDGCLRYHIRLPEGANRLMSAYERRRSVQLKAIRLLMDIKEEYGIDLMIFKTMKPYNYVPDDVDILLRNERDLKILSKILKDLGFHLIKIGTPEVVFRRVESGTYVDLDIHTRIAVGHLNIFKVEKLWSPRAHEIVDVGDGYKALKLSNEYEIVREAAYSLLKDFNLSITGFYLAINAMMQQDKTVLMRIAKEENLYPHLELYLGLAYYFVQKLYGHRKLALLHNKKLGEWKSLMFLRLCKPREIPLFYPPVVIAWAYASRVWLEIVNDKNFGVLLQTLKQPSSKGIDIFLKYLSRLLSGY